MADKPNALLLAADAPYPVIGGGALRAAALVEYLARHYELDVAVFRQEGAPDPAKTRLGLLASRVGVIELPVHARGTAARVARNLGRLLRGVPPLMDRFAGFGRDLRRLVDGRHYQLAIVEHFWCAPYVEILREHAGRVVLDLHNIESALHAGCAKAEQWPLSAMHRRFAGVARRLEAKWLPHYSLVLAASEQDAARVRAISPGVDTGVYPNTIPGAEAPERREEDVIMFSGNMEYHPNIDAVRFFAREVWPMVRGRWPRLVWELVGINPEAVRRYVGGDERIRLRGPVDDAIRELARAKAAIVPLRAGSGTRVKIIEAWAAATPVVSTTIGGEGLLARDREALLIADEPAALAGLVNDLMESASLRERIGASGRLLYEREYTWEAGWRALARLRI